MNIGTKILIVDDEQEICEILKYNLMLEGYDTEIAYSAVDALKLDLSCYSLFILDIMMDSIDGFELARKLKTNPDTMYTPIIFCSALSGEDEHIMGLNIGADDYITKPFRTREVIARVKSVLRRARVTKELSKQIQQPPVKQKPITHIEVKAPITHSAPDTSLLSYKELRIDENTKQCYINDVVVNLTKTEYEMLSFFLTHRNNIYSRKELLEKIWNNSSGVSNRTIDTNITRLRKKLGKYGSCITTRLGYGYGFQEQDI
ncbi:MAG: response regulator transcription factor [Bacteroidales bacterium]|nr:response regulator transcription factor [Bacteroidales bacterium]